MYCINSWNQFVNVQWMIVYDAQMPWICVLYNFLEHLGRQIHHAFLFPSNELEWESYRVSMVQQHLLIFPANTNIWRCHVHSQMDGFNGVALSILCKCLLLLGTMVNPEPYLFSIGSMLFVCKMLIFPLGCLLGCSPNKPHTMVKTYYQKDFRQLVKI